jgi:hypothetical protein
VHFQSFNFALKNHASAGRTLVLARCQFVYVDQLILDQQYRQFRAAANRNLPVERIGALDANVAFSSITALYCTLQLQWAMSIQGSNELALRIPEAKFLVWLRYDAGMILETMPKIGYDHRTAFSEKQQGR